MYTNSVTVVPNPVELDMFMPENISETDKTAFRKRYNIDDDVMIACFRGPAGPEKSDGCAAGILGQDYDPQDRIHLYCHRRRPAKRMEEQAKELGISEMVTFTGRSSTTSFPYLASCDIYITASLSDTNSISMLEGWPPVCRCSSDWIPLMRDQVRNRVNGYVFNSRKRWPPGCGISKHEPRAACYPQKSVTHSVIHSGAGDLAPTTC